MGNSNRVTPKHLNSISRSSKEPLNVYTFGDSILDCAHYTKARVTPAGLLLNNRDDLFPEFFKRDLTSILNQRKVDICHYAEDGSTVGRLSTQLKKAKFDKNADNIALLTIGGNDLLSSLVYGGGSFEDFEKSLETFLESLPIRPIFIGNVYDPTFGDDSKNFLHVNPEVGRQNHQKMNDILKNMGYKYGIYVDLHSHFLKKGNSEWLCHYIEPSEIGASEIRRSFLQEIEKFIN